MSKRRSTSTKKKKRDVVVDAIKQFKKDEPDWKTMDQHELYGIESYIDALLYEKEYSHYNYIDASKPGQTLSKDSELILERLVFSAIKSMQGGKRHACDLYYDDAFGGYDGF